MLRDVCSAVGCWMFGKLSYLSGEIATATAKKDFF